MSSSQLIKFNLQIMETLIWFLFSLWSLLVIIVPKGVNNFIKLQTAFFYGFTGIMHPSRGGEWFFKNSRSRKILVEFHGSRSLVFYMKVSRSLKTLWSLGLAI